MTQEKLHELRMGPQGRVVIPASVRKTLGLKQGHVLLGCVQEGRLVLESREAVLARLQARFAEAVPANVSLVEELICERRDEAHKEVRER